MTDSPRVQMDIAAWDAWRAAQKFAELARQHPELIGPNELTEAGAAIVYLEQVIHGLKRSAA